VKRAVWLRDGGRCAFVSKGLRRCKEHGRLEFHHLRPYAVGGTATVENIQIRCRAHNVFEAEMFFAGREPGRGAVRSSIGSNGRAIGIADSFRNELADPAARPV
jgi:HNH endonuclease